MNQEKIRKHIRVYGVVQGVGFRPFVSRLADSTGVTGTVANKGSYVEIFAQGSRAELEDFHYNLEKHPPERSAILKIDERDLDTEVLPDDCHISPEIFREFAIIESEKEEGDIFVSPDIGICPKCQKELYDPNNRRYMHPFINCTACGPRLTILDGMPYDRVRTSMGDFPMCPQCEYEYTHAETRRYDAQPVCCNDCGPRVYLLDIHDTGATPVYDRQAISAARRQLKAGKIIAIKGIGGFHLCCDATNEEAVSRLRTLKHRPVKPFAVMMKDLERVEKECRIPPEALETITGYQKPIILLPRKEDSHLAPSVAPGNPKVGVMLPYAPVQMLLFEYNDNFDIGTECLVMTSGNVSGAPICRTDDDVRQELSGFCDLILSHDRKIRLRADDTVMDYYQGQPYMIRRSRGYAPLPMQVSIPYKGQVLAIGGELKNSFCIGKNEWFYLSPYVGDLSDMRTVKALEESVVRMEELLEAKPSLVVSDLHPNYNSVMVAEQQGLPLVKIQHHYAHVLSCMAENDYRDPVIGISFDGTGYGTDGSIWGGEILLSDLYGFQRLGSIKPFSQVGGDTASREGWRIAASMLDSVKDLILSPQDPDPIEILDLCKTGEAKLIARMKERKINTVTSTSAGRLFDAVSAVLGICKVSTFEGEASTSLMFAAQHYHASHTEEDKEKLLEEFCREMKSLKERRETGKASEAYITLDTDILFAAITRRRLSAILNFNEEDRNKDAKACAWLFHRVLADQIGRACALLAKRTGIITAALTGGVYQNILLLEMTEKKLSEQNIHVLKHSLVPPNDGGIALGQALYGIHYYSSRVPREQ